MATRFRWRFREIGIGWKERRGRADGNSFNDCTTAVDKNLIFTDPHDGSIYLSVDTSNAFGGVATDAVRIVSKAEFTHGLFIAVINNMPGGYCDSRTQFFSSSFQGRLISLPLLLRQ
jgi:hypothetical protein